MKWHWTLTEHPTKNLITREHRNDSWQITTFSVCTSKRFSNLHGNSPVLPRCSWLPWRCLSLFAPRSSSRNHSLWTAEDPEWRCTLCRCCSPEKWLSKLICRLFELLCVFDCPDVNLHNVPAAICLQLCHFTPERWKVQASQSVSSNWRTFFNHLSKVFFISSTYPGVQQLENEFY